MTEKESQTKTMMTNKALPKRAPRRKEEKRKAQLQMRIGSHKPKVKPQMQRNTTPQRNSWKLILSQSSYMKLHLDNATT